MFSGKRNNEGSRSNWSKQLWKFGIHLSFFGGKDGVSRLRPVHVLLSRFYIDFILILSNFSNKICINPGWNLTKVFFLTLSRFYPTFIKIIYQLTLSKFYRNYMYLDKIMGWIWYKIWIKGLERAFLHNLIDFHPPKK